MESAASTLVLVAHPGDETLGFSNVCRGRISSASRMAAVKG
jgi:LmbE family N-acetylglucosaminyl deacetylase